MDATAMTAEHAPGRKVMVRANGRRDAYWVARADAVKAGYAPKTVRLTDDPGAIIAPPDVAARCRVMWAEMLEFLAGRGRSQATAYSAGTIGWLCDLYCDDTEGPLFRVRPVTREGYEKSLAIICETVGAKRIESATGRLLWRWFRTWGRADEAGVLGNPRRAYGCIQALRVVARYGVAERVAGAGEFKQILSTVEFPVPKRRGATMTRAQAVAIIAKAHELGEPGVALATALQFGCALRQKDVIGEWETINGARRWTRGLLWGEHVGPDLTLRKPTSKSNGSEVAEHNLRLIPMACAEVEAIPREQRIGPIVRDHKTGRPFIQRAYAARFRIIARAAGVPDNIWSMDARSGAITEAHEAGATLEDAMAAATHREVATNLGYRRSKIEASNRVAVARFGNGDKDA
jgi:hypothetical protein